MVLEHSAVLASARREDPQKSLPEQRSFSVNRTMVCSLKAESGSSQENCQ